MKNVLVCAVGGERHAIELRWVREIATLGALTPLPGAPLAVAGVTSFKGAMLPVMHGARWLAALYKTALRPGRGPRPGDAMVVLDVDGTRAALAVERIDAVTTLESSAGDLLVDSSGVTVALIDAQALMAAARAQVADAAADLPTLLAEGVRARP